MENNEALKLQPLRSNDELERENQSLRNQAESYARDFTSLRQQLDGLLQPIINRYMQDAFMDYVRDMDYDIRDALDLQDVVTESTLEDYAKEEDISEAVRETLETFIQDGTLSVRLEVS